MSKAKYYLYRNLHTDSFSIKHKGLVITRPKFVLMKNVEFRVSEKGRQRVLSERRKNVHATVVSERFLLLDNQNSLNMEKKIKENKVEEVYYNPYKQNQFTLKSTGEPIFEIDVAIGYNNRIYLLKDNFFQI